MCRTIAPGSGDSKPSPRNRTPRSAFAPLRTAPPCTRNSSRPVSRVRFAEPHGSQEMVGARESATEGRRRRGERCRAGEPWDGGNMRTACAIDAVTAGLAMTTVPAAAQGFYASYDQPWGYGAYAAAPGGCTCAGPSVGFGYSRGYAPGYAYAAQPGYAYSSTTYAYGSGYGYGP